MARPHTVARSRTYPVPVERAFDGTLTVPLEQLFDRRVGLIPPITRTEQDGPWGTVGQVRTVHTGDGGSVQERLLVVEAPERFTYELTDITGPMRPLAERIDGSWTFAPVGTGCRVTWSWTLHPRSGAGAVALPVFGRIWQAYARRGLDRLEELLIEGFDA